MEFNKRNRSELKQYFKINDKPTQEEFADFIDASLNQVEDGIVKVQGDPLAIQAEGEEVGALGVIDVFKSFSDENPEWSINLNPRTNPELITSNQPGFNIKDSTGQSKLFIKSGDGNVGVGTIEPTSKLTIVGKNTVSLISAIDTTNNHATVFEVAQEAGKGILCLRNNENSTITQLSGAVETPNFFLGKMGVGTDAPKTNVHVSDKNAQLRITNTDQTNGTSANFSLENEGDAERWEIGVQKGQGHLTFGTSNGGANKIVMKTGGILESASLKVSGTAEISSLNAEESVSFGSKKVSHLLQNGVFYRSGSAATLAVKNFFFIRDINDNTSSLKFYFDTKEGRLGVGGDIKPAAPLSISGTGKETHPDNAMHITDSCILFGGPNQGKQPDSAQISAGKHEPNSLNIIGMGEESERRIDFWAEGGMTVRGRIRIPQSSVVAFSVAVTTASSGKFDPVVFNHINYNIGDHFKENRFFIAPVKGLYQFIMTVSKSGSSDAYVVWHLRLNDTEYVNGTSGSEIKERSMLRARHDTNSHSRTINTLLNAGDKIRIEKTGSGTTDNYSSGFEGMLLQELM